MHSPLLLSAGYGFSSAPTKPGFGVGEIAKTFHELMLKLGYNKYVAQGRLLQFPFALSALNSYHIKPI